MVTRAGLSLTVPRSRIIITEITGLFSSATGRGGVSPGPLLGERLLVTELCCIELDV